MKIIVCLFHIYEFVCINLHRMLDPKTVILLFASGKLVFTGAKKESEVYRAVHNLHTMLEENNLMTYES